MCSSTLKYYILYNYLIKYLLEFRYQSIERNIYKSFIYIKKMILPKKL